MATVYTYGIVDKNWGLNEYFNKFFNLSKIKNFLNTVDQDLLNLKDQYELDLNKAIEDIKEYKKNILNSKFKENLLEEKKENFPKKIKDYQQCLKNKKDKLKKYTDMIDNVLSLDLIENIDTKNYMLSQIRESIIFDCDLSYCFKPQPEDEYNIDELISFELEHKEKEIRSLIKRYNNKRIELLKEKYKCIEIIDISKKL